MGIGSPSLLWTIALHRFRFLQSAQHRIGDLSVADPWGLTLAVVWEDGAFVILRKRKKSLSFFLNGIFSQPLCLIFLFCQFVCLSEQIISFDPSERKFNQLLLGLGNV